MSDDADPWGGNVEDPWAASIATGSAPKPKEESSQKGWKNFTPGQAELPEDLATGSKGGGGRVKTKQVKAPSGPNLPRKRVTESKIVGQVVEWKGKYGWIQPTETVQHQKAYKHGGKIFVSVTDLGGVRYLHPGSTCEFYVFEDEAGMGAEEVVVKDQGGAASLGRGKNNFSGSKGGSSKGGKGGRGYGFMDGKGGGRGGGRFGSMQTGIVPGLEPEHLGLGRAQGSSRSGPPTGEALSQLQSLAAGQDSSLAGGAGRKGGRGGRGYGVNGSGSSGPSGGGRGSGKPGRGGPGRGGSGQSGGPSGGFGKGGAGGGFDGASAFDRNPGGPGNAGRPSPPNSGPALGGKGWDPLIGQTLPMDKAVGGMGTSVSGASGGTAGLMAPMAPTGLPSMAMGGVGGLTMGGNAPAVGLSAPSPGMGGAIGPLAMGGCGPGVMGGMGGMPGMGGMNGMGSMNAMGNMGAGGMPGGQGYGGFGQLGPLSLGGPGGSAPGAFGAPAPMPANDLMPNPWWPGR